MRAPRTLRGRIALAFAGAALGTVLLFGAVSASVILVHDHAERARFGDLPGSAEWARADEKEARDLMLAMLAAAPFAAAAAAALGLWFATRALAPLAETAARARRALEDGEELELPVRGTGDEWDVLAEVTNELLRAKAQAAAQARAFSANAAHELRTPLTTMMGEIDLALRRERDAAGYRAALRVLDEESRRLFRLVEKLLALARTDAGLLQASELDFDLARAVRLACERAEGAHPGATARLRLRLSPATALGDPLLTGRVLDNLIENALRHGGHAVEVSVEPAGEVVRVVVSDDGPGPSPAFRDRVFERFTREARATSGSGLGLPICRALMAAQGGRVWLDGESGARFVAEFRRASADPAGYA